MATDTPNVGGTPDDDTSETTNPARPSLDFDGCDLRILGDIRMAPGVGLESVRPERNYTDQLAMSLRDSNKTLTEMESERNIYALYREQEWVLRRELRPLHREQAWAAERIGSLEKRCALLEAELQRVLRLLGDQVDYAHAPNSEETNAGGERGGGESPEVFE